ncbi:FAD-dependent oxidoreductase [Iningainema tapete]|uniref:FAD-dependent monooxygenase n=1 Tax=Iningainema tapete BLCC-T55 TaxID=2748662 RepID=A0A8J6XXA0_9CYAN|nr:NAD(P)/FAD-dependent oxidoreductase [Iningainema tapete]MBD2778072.1 FAD-dependent monooxygenase [Iningainema tapete BLCC-T55]
MVKKVVIVGAGPSGVLLAHYLLRRDSQYQIDIYERRGDPRVVPFSKSRSYPVALGERGMNALRKIEGVEEAVKALSVEMTGTVFHQKNGKKRFTSRKKPLITLDRTNLVIALLKLTEKYDSERLNIHFNYQCTQVDFTAQTVKIKNLAGQTPAELTVNYDLLIGADGARSVVREHFLSTKLFEFEQKYDRNHRKSIFLPRPDENSDIHLKQNSIHSWRLEDGTGILMLHQPDGTMNGAIRFPRQQNMILSLSTKEEVLKFFQENFPEIGKLMPESEAEAFLARPLSTVLTIRCNRYHYGNSVLLIGDAAHSVSPAIGQGCNAALEDVFIFDNLLNEYSDNLAKALEEFTIRRLPDALALVELGENVIPSSKGLIFEFMLRQRLGKILHQIFPQYFPSSIIEMIFETSVPYSEILNSYQGWVSKVKNSNKDLFTAF